MKATLGIPPSGIMLPQLLEPYWIGTWITCDCIQVAEASSKA